MEKLFDYQIEAKNKMHNGCILCGDVGTGKSRTGLAYYFERCGGIFDKTFRKMTSPKDLYIITTAAKRDKHEWEGDLIPFQLCPDDNPYNLKIVIDSWNNIEKYKKIENAFFIFDEQRVVGYGTWSKSFINITRHNEWILLSATPGDTWSDYISVFIANGFYKNKTDFNQQHCVYSRFVSYPKIDRYVNIGRLIRLRERVLVTMGDRTTFEKHHLYCNCSYDIINYMKTMRERFNYEKNEPFKNAAELCYALRQIVNSDESRIEAVLDIFEKKKRVIIFYNYDYELEILKSVDWGSIYPDVKVAEWNGHKHQPVPSIDDEGNEIFHWVYLVQYTAGSEGWNCIKTDTIIFYSQSYSYKATVQAAGRISRLNTPFNDLYFYHLTSKSKIDLAISNALHNKKKFNETSFIGKNAFPMKQKQST